MLRRKLRRGALSLAALAGSVNASCVNFHPGPETIPPAEAGTPPHLAWTLHAGRGVSNPVAADDRSIYVAGADRIVRAIALDSGRVRWTFRLSGNVLDGVLRADSSVYVASVRPEGHVVALRADDGRKRWSATVGETSAPMALIAGVLIVPTRKGDLLGLTARDGVIHWRRRVGYTRSAATEGAGAVVVSSLDSMFRISVADGHVVQRRAAPGPMLVPWVNAGDVLVGALADSMIVGVRAADLTTLWQTPLDAPVFSAPALRGDTIYVASRIGTLYRVNAGTGRAEVIMRLHWPLASGPVPVGASLLVGGADGTIRAMSPAGEAEWRVAAWRPAATPPLIVRDGLIVIGGNGDFYRYDP